LLEIGTRREGQRVRHTNLLSPHAWSPHESGSKKVRRLQSASVGGHGPFRGLDAPLALMFFYHDRGKKDNRQLTRLNRKKVESTIPLALLSATQATDGFHSIQ
jgi:hypothetical protein